LDHKMTKFSAEINNLDDLPLMEIIKCLDFDSQLQMMATCTRFHELVQCDQNFVNFSKLVITRDFLNDREKSEALENPHRYFGVVVLKGLNFQENEEHFKKIFELFEKIGSGISLLYFREISLLESQLLELLGKTIKVRALNFSRVQIPPAAGRPNEMPKQLNRLEYLKFGEGSIPAHLSDIVPNTLKILNFGWNSHDEDWTTAQRYFGKQKRLKKLSIGAHEIAQFEFDSECTQIESLELYLTRFRNSTAFQSLSDFMRAQKNIHTVFLDVTLDESEFGNNYKEICKHLLKQKTLKSFTLQSEMILDLLRIMECPNTTLEELILTIFEEDFDYSQIARLFPNLSSLSLETISWNRILDVAPDVAALNSLKNLKSLNLDPANEQMLEQLEIKSLSSIGIHSNSILDKATWNRFLRTHNHLKCLSTSALTIEHIENILVDLPNLDNLQCFRMAQITDDNERLAIKIIEKLFQKLENFMILVKFTNPEATAILKMNCPGISIEVKRERVIIKKTKDCLWSEKELKSLYKTLS
jgi:hypothetical protein